LSGENRQLAFGHVEPTAMFGRVVPLEFAGDASRLVRWEAVVQAGNRVGVEIVRDQDNGLGLRILGTV
jgi:hypothetical protein